ncbi:hypothetical protein HYS47_02325 [Candidatus Woesearchaeota archaeon]|nr:hypothetical protein [Candidatus Woesearchaeota archaeon]
MISNVSNNISNNNVTQGAEENILHHSAFSYIFRHRHARKFIVWCMIWLLFLLLLAIKDWLLLGILLAANILVSIAMRPLKRFTIGIAVELVTFSSVIAGMVYGPTIGALFAMVSLITNFFFIGRVTMFLLLVIPVYAGIGALASLFSSTALANPTIAATAGILLTMLYNFIVSFLIIALFAGNIKKCITFSSINIAVNVLLFANLAVPLIRVMA